MVRTSRWFAANFFQFGRPGALSTVARFRSGFPFVDLFVLSGQHCPDHSSFFTYLSRQRIVELTEAFAARLVAAG
jgi:hypothetical protein